MTCTACRRANLPGGLRCAYCGAYLPQSLEFDLSATAAPIAMPEVAPAPAAPADGQGAKQAQRAGLIGTIVVLALKAKSLLALFKFGKIATTLLSMAVFIWADAKLFGWRFGVGLAVSILIHEMGHVIVNWRKGLKQTAPMFIPFVGAVIFIKQFPNDPTIESESGAGGPVAGGLAALACLGIAQLTKDPFWLSLAHIGFAINLFNLVPFPPLDGSHIGSVFSPRLWGVVLVAMLLWALKIPSTMLWMVLVIGALLRFGHRDDGRYLLAAPPVRARMALVYLVLCLGLSWGSEQTVAARASFQQAATSVTSGIVSRPATVDNGQAGEGWLLLGAFSAALGAALIYTVYASIRSKGAGMSRRTAGAALRARRLAWAAGGAALVAYWSGSLLVAGVLAAVVALFYLRNPWALLAVAGEVADALGDSERALDYLTRAAERCPKREERAILWQNVARRSLPLDRGAATLGALENRDGAGGQPTDVLAEMNMRASALGLTTRFDEALACCEQMLQAAATDPRRGLAANFLVHARLARFAQIRGWHDEAVAQSDWCLKRLTPAATSLAAELHALRAEALASQSGAVPGEVGNGFAEAAAAACDAALERSREPSIQAWVATVRAQLALRAGDRDAADREAKRAVQLLPGHLGCLYWRGRIASPADLERLAAKFPEDYWGRRARQEMDPSSFEPPTSDSARESCRAHGAETFQTN
jgi:Zn-dependent protease/tetratricopeptide (TPR) repeat protein